MSVEEKNAMVDCLMKKLDSKVQTHIRDYISDTLIIACKALSKSVQFKLVSEIYAKVKKDPANSF